MEFNSSELSRLYYEQSDRFAAMRLEFDAARKDRDRLEREVRELRTKTLLIETGSKEAELREQLEAALSERDRAARRIVTAPHGTFRELFGMAMDLKCEYALVPLCDGDNQAVPETFEVGES